MADAADLTGLALTPAERRAADVRAREEVVFAGALRRAAGRAAGVKAVEGSGPAPRRRQTERQRQRQRHTDTQTHRERRAAGRAAGVKSVEGSDPFSVWSGQQPLCLCLFGLTNLVGPGACPLQS